MCTTKKKYEQSRSHWQRINAKWSQSLIKCGRKIRHAWLSYLFFQRDETRRDHYNSLICPIYVYRSLPADFSFIAWFPRRQNCREEGEQARISFALFAVFGVQPLAVTFGLVSCRKIPSSAGLAVAELRSALFLNTAAVTPALFCSSCTSPLCITCWFSNPHI